MEKFEINPAVLDQAAGLRRREAAIPKEKKPAGEPTHLSKQPFDQAQRLRELAAAEKDRETK